MRGLCVGMFPCNCNGICVSVVWRICGRMFADGACFLDDENDVCVCVCEMGT